jgi:hypothetical protein
MATQRYISTSFWDDPWIRKLTPDERYLYLYFLTNPLTNIAGVYQISIDRIAFDTGYTEEKILDTLKKFEAAGKAYYYNKEYMVLPTWPKHQNWEKRPKINAGIKLCLEKLDPPLLSFLVKIRYRYPMDTLSISYDKVSISYTYPTNYSDLDPSGLVGDEAKIKEFSPFTKTGRTVIDVIDGITYSIDSLGILKQCYKITDNFSDEEIIGAIITARTPE